MKKRGRIIFCGILFAILISLSVFTAAKIKNNDGAAKIKNTEEKQNLLSARVFTVENTYYGAEYTFQFLNNTEEDEKYIKVQYHENEAYSADIGHIPVGSDVEIKYQGDVSKYTGEWDVGGQCFVLDLHDIVSILPDE